MQLIPKPSPSEAAMKQLTLRKLAQLTGHIDSLLATYCQGQFGPVTQCQKTRPELAAQQEPAEAAGPTSDFVSLTERDDPLYVLEPSYSIESLEDEREIITDPLKMKSEEVRPYQSNLLGDSAQAPSSYADGFQTPNFLRFDEQCVLSLKSSQHHLDIHFGNKPPRLSQLELDRALSPAAVQAQRKLSDQSHLSMAPAPTIVSKTAPSVVRKEAANVAKVVPAGQVKKKIEKKRLTESQRLFLENEFEKCSKWSRAHVMSLAKTLNLGEVRVYKWNYDQQRRVNASKEVKTAAAVKVQQTLPGTITK